MAKSVATFPAVFSQLLVGTGSGTTGSLRPCLTGSAAGGAGSANGAGAAGAAGGAGNAGFAGAAGAAGAAAGGRGGSGALGFLNIDFIIFPKPPNLKPR